jgi:hypothetical protein
MKKKVRFSFFFQFCDIAQKYLATYDYRPNMNVVLKKNLLYSGYFLEPSVEI